MTRSAHGNNGLNSQEESCQEKIVGVLGTVHETDTKTTANRFAVRRKSWGKKR